MHASLLNARRPQAKELNTAWEDGGDGVPKQDTAVVAAKTSGIIATAKVGDGGASWRMKALKRAQAAAAEEGRSVNEVVAQRFDSLKALTASLTERRPAHCEYWWCSAAWCCCP